MCLRGAYHLIYLHLRKVLLYLDFISFLLANQPQSITHVLVLNGHLEILDLHTLMFLLQLEKVFPQLQVRLQDLLDHIDGKDQAICRGMREQRVLWVGLT